MDEAEEVFDLDFPAGDQSAEVVQPSENPLDLPAAAVAAQWSPVLGLMAALTPVGRDHFDAAGAHLLVQRVRVVGLVADQPDRQLR